MTKLRQTIARRLKDAQNTAAMLTTFNEVDMTEVMAMRARYKDAFEKKHGAKLGFMGFFVKSCVQALKEIPAVNAEIDGADLVYKNYYHLGIAVGTEKGLIVPVVRDCDKLSVAEIERAIADLGRRAREGQLKLEELQGGTFTITNGGIYGSLMSTPILNAPQSGILGMHKIQDRPVVSRRQDRDPADDVSGAELRPPPRRRQGGGDLPRARQGGAGRPGEAGAGSMTAVAPTVAIVDGVKIQFWAAVEADREPEKLRAISFEWIGWMDGYYAVVDLRPVISDGEMFEFLRGSPERFNEVRSRGEAGGSANAPQQDSLARSRFRRQPTAVVQS